MINIHTKVDFVYELHNYSAIIVTLHVKAFHL